MQPRECRAVVYNADCRRMPELADGCVDLAVTSPPYWQIKDYGSTGQIGFGQSLHEYLGDLARVWAECLRVLRPGGRLCVNVGDQFARASLFGRYRVIPLHAEIICQCVELGYDFLGSVIWRKKTTMNTTGGAVVMGSYPYPPNGIVEIDFEYILLFKTPGASRLPGREVKAGAALTREEWKSWFSGHWDIAGARKKGHDAPFPDEVPRRLIRMFSFPGATVLDPFLGTGTTARMALALGRNAVGYEIKAEYIDADLPVIVPARNAEVMGDEDSGRRLPRPRVPDLRAPPPVPGPEKSVPRLHTVRAVEPDCSLVLDTGTVVRFLGLRIQDEAAARAYLAARVVRKRVFLRDAQAEGDSAVRARVILKNRISINAQLVKSGAAREIGTNGGA